MHAHEEAGPAQRDNRDCQSRISLAGRTEDRRSEEADESLSYERQSLRPEQAAEMGNTGEGSS
jgi:hypothetical protein